MKFGRGARAKGAEKFLNLNPGVTGLSPPSQKGGVIFLGISPLGANTLGISPPLGYSPAIYAIWFIQIIS